MGAKYYHSELAYLREMGREFALANPSVAGLLAEKGSDPDVERLLEGFAFLTARIRERVDDAVPSIVHGLTELLIPHYLRPVPATAVIQFEPELKALRGAHRIPRGTSVLGKPMEGTSCQFRTTSDVELLPVAVRDVTLDETVAARPVIRIALRTTEAGRSLIARKEGLRFLLHGDIAVSSTLMLWLARHLADVRVQTSPDGAPVRLGRDAVIPVGSPPEQALFPWPTFAPEGYRAVLEYFTLPSKFLFFEVTGLEPLEVEDDTIELAFEFERPPPLPARIGRDTFRLHCTPVVNLFDVSADPIKRDAMVHEYLLRAAGVRPRHMEVFEVVSVVGIRPGRAARRDYQPFYGFAHSGEDDTAYYAIRRDHSPVDDGIDTYLSIMQPRDVAPAEVEETLSIELCCTNRSLPNELQVGEISVAGRGSAILAPFRNITAVTTPIRPPLGGELHWRLLSHLALNRRSIAEPEALRALLSLYNFQREISPQSGRANELRIQAIRSVVAEPVTRLLSGAPVRGVRTSVEMEETKLQGAGDVHLFGMVLDELFAAHVPINSFNELHVQLHPSKLGYRWQPRNGRQAIV